MSVPVCSREADALEIVLGGGWPGCADTELRAHVEQCPVCADVVAVAVAMQEEQAFAIQQAHVPSAGLVWWRAELRARQEATRKATRPMTFVQGIAAACGIAALLTIASMLSPWVRSQLAGFVDVSVRLPTVDAAAVTGLFAQGGLALLLALGAWLVLVPVALYMVFSRD